MSGATRVLDDEFLFLASLLRPVFAALTEHRDEARLWLERLCLVPAAVDSARRDRNEYLCRLYHGIMAGKLDAVFLDEPPEGALRPAAEVFPPVDTEAWLDDVEADEAPLATGQQQGRGDADERTYVATQVLPGGRGAFGYLAVSLAKAGPHWVGEEDSVGWRAGLPTAASTPVLPPRGTMGAAPEDLSRIEAAEPFDGLLGLGDRPPPEQRQQLLDFYDSLIDDLDRAMVEPENTSADVEKLLTSLHESSSTTWDGTPDDSRQRELLAQLRERLMLRRSRAEQRSLTLDSIQLELSQTEQSPPRVQQRTRRNARDEDDVWNIRPENVGLLEAAYPRQLVQRFLDALVRERVAVLGRVHARRYCKRRVEGFEEDAAEDMEHYRDSTAAWASMLRAGGHGVDAQDSAAAAAAATAAATQADRTVDLATKVVGAIRELAEARKQYFANEETQKGVQERLMADIEMLRAEEAVLTRRVRRMLGRASN